MEKQEAVAYRRPQAATRLSVSLRKLDELILSGQIKSFKVGKIRLISEESLANFIKKQEAASR